MEEMVKEIDEYVCLGKEEWTVSGEYEAVGELNRTETGDECGEVG